MLMVNSPDFLISENLSSHYNPKNFFV